MIEAIADAADDVAADTRDSSYDDATSRGGLLYRRARNRIVALFRDDPHVTLDTTDNALHIRSGSLALSFYAARDGLELPKLSGSETKRRVVAEMEQMVIPGLEVAQWRIVIMHESDEDGLVRAALGVLRDAKNWAWNVLAYDRFADDALAADGNETPSYEEQPEAELPPIERRDDVDAGEAKEK